MKALYCAGAIIALLVLACTLIAMFSGKLRPEFAIPVLIVSALCIAQCAGSIDCLEGQDSQLS